MGCGFNWVPRTSSLYQRNEDPQKVCLTIISLSSNPLEPKLFTLIAQTVFLPLLKCQTGPLLLAPDNHILNK